MKSKLQFSTKINQRGETALDRYFVQPPFKLMSLPNTTNLWPQALMAMQMSSSPGLLAGDDLSIEITLAPHSQLILMTQAFTRVQSMHAGEFAKQSLGIHLGAGSRLYYVPHPLVLHKDSALEQTTEIVMENGSQMIFAEIVAIGRAQNDERFEFARFGSHLSVYKKDHLHQDLLISDCIQWHPKLMDLTAIGQMEQYSHQGMLLFINIGADGAGLSQCLDLIQEIIEVEELSCPALLIGASLLQSHGLVVRALACSAQHIERAFERIGHAIQGFDLADC